MSRIPFPFVRPTLMMIGLFAIAAVAVTDSPAQAQRREHREDARACSSFGLSYGSRGYRACMEELQRRGDPARMSTLEEMAITSQIAKDGQVMAERARRQRCDRNPDRRECGPR